MYHLFNLQPFYCKVYGCLLIFVYHWRKHWSDICSLHKTSLSVWIVFISPSRYSRKWFILCKQFHESLNVAKIWCFLIFFILWLYIFYLHYFVDYFFISKILNWRKISSSAYILNMCCILCTIRTYFLSSMYHFQLNKTGLYFVVEFSSNHLLARIFTTTHFSPSGNILFNKIIQEINGFKGNVSCNKLLNVHFNQLITCDY